LQAKILRRGEMEGMRKRLLLCAPLPFVEYLSFYHTMLADARSLVKEECGSFAKEFYSAGKEFCRLGKESGLAEEELYSLAKEFGLAKLLSGRVAKEFGRLKLLCC
jgi:hypothetical protein